MKDKKNFLNEETIINLHNKISKYEELLKLKNKEILSLNETLNKNLNEQNIMNNDNKKLKYEIDEKIEKYEPIIIINDIDLSINELKNKIKLKNENDKRITKSN